MRTIKTNITRDTLNGLCNALLQDSYGIDYNPIKVITLDDWLELLDPNKFMIQPSDTDNCIGLGMMDDRCNRSAIIARDEVVELMVDTDKKPLPLFGFVAVDGKLKHPMLKDVIICEL